MPSKINFESDSMKEIRSIEARLKQFHAELRHLSRDVYRIRPESYDNNDLAFENDMEEIFEQLSDISYID